jgi:hypothetical protein
MFDRAIVTIFEGPSYRIKGRIVLSDVDNKKD